MLEEQFIEYEFRKVPLLVKKHIESDKLKKNLKDRIGKRIKFISDNETAKEFMSIINHANKITEDYCYHLMDIGESNSLISRINFEEINPVKKPFVTIHLKNFDILNYKDLENMLKIIYERYKRFSPEYIRFFEFGEQEAGQNFERVDNFVVGNINNIKKHPQPERYNEVEINKVKDLSFYKKYFEEYTKLKEEEKMFETERIESEKDFEDYLATGIIYKIKIDNEFAGIYALKKINMNSLSGFYVVEQVLFKNFRGHNFAASVQKKAIDNLTADNDEFIYGNIYPKNKASLKTAMKCGRYIAGSYFKLKF